MVKLNQGERLGEQTSSSILEIPFLLFIFFRYYWIFSLCITFSFLSSVLLHWCKDHSILSPIASHHDLLNFVSVRIIISLSTLMYEFVRCTMTNRITRSSDQIKPERYIISIEYNFHISFLGEVILYIAIKYTMFEGKLAFFFQAAIVRITRQMSHIWDTCTQGEEWDWWRKNKGKIKPWYMYSLE